VVIFCAGAVSQLESWDYKPELIKFDGKPLEGGPAVTFQGPAGELARPQYEFRRRGQTGKWVSDMIPHLAELTDDIAFVQSLTSKSNTHGPAENFLSTGNVLDGFPSLGSWLTYALGSVNRLVESGTALTQALDLAERINARAPNAMQSIKELINDASTQSLNAHLAQEQDNFVKNLHHPNAGIGISAFLNKEKPTYK